MKKGFSLFICLFISLSVLSSNNNLAKVYKQLGLSDNISYTADMKVKNESQGLDNVVFKMFFKNGNIRTEGEQAGMQFVMILRKEGTMYTFNQAMNMWIETKMNDVMGADVMPDYKELGEETVDGKKCKKFIYDDPKTGFQTVVWTHDGTIFKNVSKQGNGPEHVVYYENIVKKNIDDALFMPPKDAQIQDMNTMMQSFMKEQQQNQ